MSAEQEQELPLFKQVPSPPSAPASVPVESDEKGSTKPFSKFIVYVDESGDHGMQTIDANYPVFVLAFCVFHKVHYSEKVVPALEKFKFKHFGHDQIVLHENEIRKEKGRFRIFPAREQKESNFILISCVIEKNRLREEEKSPNPYHIALRFCLETLHQFLEEKGEQDKITHVVVEQRGEKEDKDLELEFRRICAGQNCMEKPLPFQILFSDKKAMSSGLQLADLVARPIGLSVFRGEQGNRAFEVLKKKFFCAGGRANVGADYQEWGLKIFPAQKSERPR